MQGVKFGVTKVVPVPDVRPLCVAGVLLGESLPGALCDELGVVHGELKSDWDISDTLGVPEQSDSLP